MSNKLPEAFIEKMTDLLQEDAHEFFNTYRKSRAAGYRINPLKVTKNQWENLSPFSTEPIPFVNNGYYYSFENEEPGKHPYHAAGVYYIQEPSAMFVAELLEAKPGEKILDLCAAPGGKSTQIGSMMDSRGLLIANEVNPKRAKILSENIERFGIKNAIVTNETPANLAERFPNYFDKILVDAPCSGEGMFRKDPEATLYWSQDHVLECQKLQKEILDQAYRMLGNEGILVYSTCTFSPEENEQVIESFLKKYPDMELLTIEKKGNISDGHPEWTVSKLEQIYKTARLWPHHLKGEGHFAAKLMKRSRESDGKQKLFKITTKNNDIKDFIQFQEQFLQDISFDSLVIFGSNLHSLPEQCPDLRGLKVLRSGLHLGELKKNRFEPNHALALALKKEEVKQVHPLQSSSDEWLRYLKGETLTGSGMKGWVLITVDDFSLGWGKETDRMIKNLYPKGLRIVK